MYSEIIVWGLMGGCSSYIICENILVLPMRYVMAATLTGTIAGMMRGYTGLDIFTIVSHK
jgi:hypothetical protein